MSDAAALLIAACDDPGAVAARLVGEGQPVIRVLGQDAPYALLRAAGRAPVRLVPRPGPTPDADELAGDGTLSQRGRSLLQQIVADTSGTPLLFTHADTELPQLFATVRDLIHEGDIPARPIHMLDLGHQPRESSRAYNAARIAQLVAWLGGVEVDRLAACASEERARPAAMAHLAGVLRIAAIGAAHALPPTEWLGLVRQTAADPAGEPVFVLGSPQFSTARARDLAARGLDARANDQDWGDPLVAAWADSPATLDALADPGRLTPRKLIPAADRAAAVIARMTALGIARAVFVESVGDEAAAWDAGYFVRTLDAAGFAVERIGAPPLPAPASDTPRPTPRAQDGRRSRKSLASIASFGVYQRDWFKSVRAEVAAGAPLALVNANSPQEILRAMGVPFVVNQWWASIAAAKQQSPRYFQLLRDHGYPSDAEAYSAQGIAAMFDTDAEQAPWGGLPRPAFVQAPIGTDATPRIFDHWARETGADPFLFERSIESRIDFPIDWWDRLHDDWDSAIEPERLDLMTAELHAVIARIEAVTDRRFDPDRFAHIMDLVNEQEDCYRRTRDLIAGAHPAPVSISDTMPATMVPQWHRGTEWARDAARDFYHEVKARHDAGEAACPNEKLRLMWVGRGMWSDMGFTQRWEESHAAVFVWSMYLSLAADGYIRRTAPGQDPMRALAARFVTMGDELRMPTWAGAWHVREAKSHAVDGAVALSDADPFVLRALRRAGVPVLSLDLDNYNREASDGDAVDRQIAAFLEGPVTAYAARRD
ncbi:MULTISPECIES: 2-hydroxyacyl-CoA dehydratase family protein [unclassified Sphingomonas]|uniref:2-hydroxyacyl-CoA dehydratase family protein n=1 Tax=unclassified Sphingomonas TaxID=196159 RepID=UPI0021517CC5|nr:MULTISPECIES: 2-hydroxyacyl-CoA dehydratase family protein [unclassified Sphingomonas]MCR5872509.1 2-hydroxyacyl-CoA dehydratase family protein [Sphingomonas sp. J344]UUX99208.1 2-hydroxyacyl-CoA dehydratase family protein [Sphingomonas sp. J315]